MSVQPTTSTSAQPATKPTLKDKITGAAHKLSPKHLFGKHKAHAAEDKVETKPATAPAASSPTATAPAPEAPHSVAAP